MTRFLVMFGLLAGVGVLGTTDTAEAQGRSGYYSPYYGQYRQRYSPPTTYRRYVSTGTGIVVNRREINRQELYTLQQIVGYVPRGRYWLNQNGSYGLEGGPMMGNLFGNYRRNGRRSRIPPGGNGSLLSGSFLTGLKLY